MSREQTGMSEERDRLFAAARAGRRATLDPGAFVKRGRDGDGDYERLDRWQERALVAAVDALPTSTDLSGGQPAAESQVWERRIPGTDVPLQRVHLHVDEHGRARVHEAVLAQLLHEAGWERAS